MTKDLENSIEEITLGGKTFAVGVESYQVGSGDLIEVNGNFEEINAKRFDGISGTWYETPHGEFHSCMIQNYGKRISD